MRKLVATTIATATILFGVFITTASAEEHKVVKGDNLWNIAQKYDTTVRELVDLNELDTTIIQPKQIIIINDLYIVEAGDTLDSIAKEFDVKVKEIKKWNDLNSSTIKEGQELVIKGLHDEEKDNKVETKNKSKTKKSSQSKKSTEGKTISVSATAYTAKCNGCSGITYTGVDLNSNPNAKVIAVDPNVIPLGSKVYVEGYGHAVAADIGGAIKGNKIDLHVPTKQEAFSWGVRNVKVTILD